MAELKLNTTSSITDFLKAQGKDSSFGARKSLYETSGLKDRLGDYVGSASQNVAFLKNLQTPAQTGAVPTGQDPNFNPNAALQTPGSLGIAPTAPITTPAPQTPTPTPTIGSSGLTASQAASSIPTMPSADEILNSVLQSSGFANFRQQQDLSTTLATGTAESQKAALESKTAADTKSFIDNMGRRGLFFSGETQSGIQALGESLLSSKLDIDRKLAGDLLSSDLKTQEQIIKQVGEIVKDAQAGRKEALSALEKVGLTVIGGEVVPTLAARSAERADAAAVRAEESQVLALQREERLTQASEASQELAQAKFELSQAKSAQQMELATARLELSQARFEQTAANLSAPERKGQAAVQLYGSTIQAVVDAGLDPGAALEAVNNQANATGVILDVETQNAIIQHAGQLAVEKEKAKTPLQRANISLPAGPQNKLTDKPKTSNAFSLPSIGNQSNNPINGFFSNLFKF